MRVLHSKYFKRAAVLVRLYGNDCISHRLRSEENKVDEDADVDYNVVAVNCKNDFEL